MNHRRRFLLRGATQTFVLAALIACGTTDPPVGGPEVPSPAALKIPKSLSVLIEPVGPPAILPSETFGKTVALSGLRVAVADFLDFDLMGFRFTHVDTYEIRDGVAVGTGRLPATGYAAERCFGAAMAMDGDLLAVGEPCAGAGTGAVHVYRFEGGGWIEEPLLSPPAQEARPMFGATIAMAANRMVIGSRFETAPGPVYGAGAAYVYVRNGGAWRLSARLAPSDPQPFEEFGAGLAMTASTIAVGAPEHANVDALGLPLLAHGRVTLFLLQPDGSWREGTSLAVTDGAVNENTARTLALCSGTLFVAGDGWDWPAVHLFQGAADVWVEGDLTEPVGAIPPLAKVDSMACEGDLLMVGMPFASPDGATWLGVARGYKKVSGAWQRVAELTGTAAGDRAGHGVAVYNGVVAVGMPNAVVAGRSAGSVRVQRF